MDGRRGGRAPGPASAAGAVRGSSWARSALAVAAALLGWGAVALATRPWLVSDDGGRFFHLDAWIYRAAVSQWQAGGSLYDWWANPVEHLWPFTYPPFAAWALTPLSWMSDDSAQTLLTVATPLAVAATLWACLRAVLPEDPAGCAVGRLTGWGRPARVAVAVPWLTAACVALIEPVYKTMEYGQVNAVLMALVAVDLLAVPRGSRWRGVLSGLAAAFKLTPAIAVLVLLARREWRAATTMVAAALAVTAGAWVVSPAESWRFFSEAMWDPTRAGLADYAGNQNLRAVLARAWPVWASESALSAVWAGVVAAAVAGTWVLLRRLERAGAGSTGSTGSTGSGSVLLLQLSATMVLGLLVSPISWSHHWVWVVPALFALVFAARQWGGRGLLGAALGGGLVFLAAAHWWFTEGHHVERDWPWWQQLLGSSYTWWAVVAGVCVGVGVGRRGRARRERQAPQAPGACSPAPSGTPNA